jgi:hypothetical protein
MEQSLFSHKSHFRGRGKAAGDASVRAGSGPPEIHEQRGRILVPYLAALFSRRWLLTTDRRPTA